MNGHRELDPSAGSASRDFERENIRLESVVVVERKEEEETWAHSANPPSSQVGRCSWRHAGNVKGLLRDSR